MEKCILKKVVAVFIAILLIVLMPINAGVVNAAQVNGNNPIDVNSVTNQSGTVNFVIRARWFETKSGNKLTLTMYGMSGSVDYNGSSISNVYVKGYHDPKTEYENKYNCTYSISKEYTNDGIKITLHSALYNLPNNDNSNTSEISIFINKDGTSSITGPYSSYRIF